VLPYLVYETGEYSLLRQNFVLVPAGNSSSLFNSFSYTLNEHLIYRIAQNRLVAG
jgi:hypothetical protein